MKLQTAVRKAARKFGIEIHFYSPDNTLDPWDDMAALLAGHKGEIVAFDVGANVGQTTALLRHTLPNVAVHAFEPSPSVFAELMKRVGFLPDGILNNCGVGSKVGNLELMESSHSVQTSFLKLGIDGEGTVIARNSVPVITVDGYCADKGIEKIDILKIDTQGFDFEVLKGADQKLRQGSIGLVYMELIFAKLYENLPRFDHIYGFMIDRDYSLVAMYDHHRKNRILEWTNVVFASPAIARQEGIGVTVGPAKLLSSR